MEHAHSSPVASDVLRQLLESDDEDEAVGHMLQNDTLGSSASAAWNAVPFLPNSGLASSSWGPEQSQALQSLQDQLAQQQALLQQLQQQQQQGASAMVTESHDLQNGKSGSNAGRRAARRAATAKQRAEVADLEQRLKGVADVHSRLSTENGLLRRRVTLLESCVRMREQHLEGLMRGRRRQQVRLARKVMSLRH